MASSTSSGSLSMGILARHLYLADSGLEDPFDIGRVHLLKRKTFTQTRELRVILSYVVPTRICAGCCCKVLSSQWRGSL